MSDPIGRQTLFVILAIFAVAGGGMLLNWALRGRSQSQSRMGTRFLVQLVALLAIFVPAYLGPPWLFGAAALLACLTSAELYGTFEEGGDSPWKLSGIAIGLGLMLAAYAAPGRIGVWFAGVLILYWVLRFAAGAAPDSLLARARRTCFGVLYPFLCLAFCVEIGRLEGGFGYVVLYYGLAELNDAFDKVIAAEQASKRLRALTREVVLPSNVEALIDQAGDAFDAEDAELVRTAQAAVARVIAVDDFDPDAVKPNYAAPEKGNGINKDDQQAAE